MFQVCYARVLDYRRKFIEAAQRYNELSYKNKNIVAEEERMEALKKALICTILASAGESHNIYRLICFRLDSSDHDQKGTQLNS